MRSDKERQTDPSSVAMTSVTPAEGAEDVPRKGYLPRIGSWLSAALDDPNVCADMKADILAWFDADMPAPDLAASLAEARSALHEARMQAIADDARVEMVCEDLAKETAVVQRLLAENQVQRALLSDPELVGRQVAAEIAVLRAENAKFAAELKEAWAEVERLKLDVDHWRDCATTHMSQAFKNSEETLDARDEVAALRAQNETMRAALQQIAEIGERGDDLHGYVTQTARAALAQSSGGEANDG